MKNSEFSTQSIFNSTFYSICCLGLFLTACSPASNSGDVGSKPKLEAMGTVSGGGGNGCNGKAFETYSRRITDSIEYRMYIKPILRRISEQGNDPFLTYLVWTAEEKPWYFVPCELGKLTPEQIGVSINSDQLALHTENGIFVHSNDEDLSVSSYATQTPKKRARLLLHEMVMGAKLLMKKPPTVQCQALSKQNFKICSDPTVFSIAEAPQVDPKESATVTATEHDEIRAMTVYLAEPGADLSGRRIRQMRKRLNFTFPWDRAVPELQFNEIATALERSELARDQYAVLNPSNELFAGVPTKCTLDLRNRNSTTIGFSLTLTHALPIEELAKRAPGRGYYNTCLPNPGGVQLESNAQSECRGYHRSWYSRPYWWISERTAQIKGVFRDGEFYDRVRLQTKWNDGTLSTDLTHGPREAEAAFFDLYFTRGEQPRLEAIRIEPKVVLGDRDANSRRKSDPARAPLVRPTRPEGVALPAVEYMDDPTLPAIECRRIKLAK